jgi:hypothetical protein
MSPPPFSDPAWLTAIVPAGLLLVAAHFFGPMPRSPRR